MITFSVEVCTSGFSGLNSQVDVRRDDFYRFLNEFKTLEATRNGTATLESHEPTPFKELYLHFYTYNRRGHIAEKVDLQKYTVAGDGLWLKVSGGFELDDKCLSVLDGLIELAEAINNATTQG
jgi:hypothetical protein